MSRKSMTARAPTAEAKHSRAALRTMRLAVEAVADALRRLGALQSNVYHSRQAALATLQAARQHSLKDAELGPIEDGIGQLAKRLDWPRSISARVHNEHLERPLTAPESHMVGRWAGSAHVLTVGMLDIGEQLDAWYAGLVVTAAGVARAASCRVTVTAHKRRAAKLMLRLDGLCADERVAWAFDAPGEDDWSISRRTLH
jgi:hypothetical protein